MRRSWIAAAAVLLGTGWGANQFAPMLLVYQHDLGLDTAVVEAMFGVYALGLIPGLLIAGPLADARGRRAVVVPAAALSLVSSLVLVAGAHSVALLVAGRFLAGISSGAVFGAGTAWLRELSVPPVGDATPETAARRAAIAMTVGFGLGPLVAGLLAQWVPAPRVIAYAPHLVLMIVVLMSLRRTPETVIERTGRVRFLIPGLGAYRFRRVVAPMAPWVFAAPAIGFALLPSVVGADTARDGIAVTAAVTALTAFTGVFVQPLARRLDTGTARNRAAVLGLLILTVGLLAASLTAARDARWALVPCAILFGAAYGLCLVAGLIEVGRMAGRDALARLTAAYYALTYIGFAAPFVLALAAHVTTYPILLVIVAGLAAATAAVVAFTPDRSSAIASQA
jgi:predicted MFS family arabinose efflux permease